MARLKHNIAANYLGQAWVAAMGLAFVPTYIRLLGMEAYGLIGLFAMLQTWLALLDAGMTPTLSREMARYKAGAHDPRGIVDLLRSVELLAGIVATAIALCSYASASSIADAWLKARHLPGSTVAEAISVMGLVLSLRMFEGLYRGALYGLQHQVWYNATAAALATLRHGGAVLVLTWLSPSIQAFFGWQLAVSTVTVLVFAWKVHRSVPASPSPARFSAAAIAPVWKFAAGMLGITCLSLLLTQTDKVLLSRLLPLDIFGQYTLAATLAATLHLIVGPIMQSVYPRMVDLVAKGDEGELVALYHKAARAVTALTAPAALLLVLFPGEALFVWSGNADLGRDAAPILSALAAGAFFNSLMWVPYQCQLAHGWTNLSLGVNGAAVALLVPGLFWIVPRFGPVGAALVSLGLNAVYLLVDVQFMHARLLRREKWRWYLLDVGLPVVGSLLAGVASVPLEPAPYESRIAWFFFLLGTGALALALSTLIALRVRRPRFSFAA